MGGGDLGGLGREPAGGDFEYDPNDLELDESAGAELAAPPAAAGSLRAPLLQRGLSEESGLDLAPRADPQAALKGLFSGEEAPNAKLSNSTIGNLLRQGHTTESLTQAAGDMRTADMGQLGLLDRLAHEGGFLGFLAGLVGGDASKGRKIEGRHDAMVAAIGSYRPEAPARGMGREDASPDFSAAMGLEEDDDEADDLGAAPRGMGREDASPDFSAAPRGEMRREGRLGGDGGAATVEGSARGGVSVSKEIDKKMDEVNAQNVELRAQLLEPGADRADLLEKIAKSDVERAELKQSRAKLFGFEDDEEDDDGAAAVELGLHDVGDQGELNEWEFSPPVAVGTPYTGPRRPERGKPFNAASSAEFAALAEEGAPLADYQFRNVGADGSCWLRSYMYGALGRAGGDAEQLDAFTNKMTNEDFVTRMKARIVGMDVTEIDRRVANFKAAMESLKGKTGDDFALQMSHPDVQKAFQEYMRPATSQALYEQQYATLSEVPDGSDAKTAAEIEASARMTAGGPDSDAVNVLRDRAFAGATEFTALNALLGGTGDIYYVQQLSRPGEPPQYRLANAAETYSNSERNPVGDRLSVREELARLAGEGAVILMQTGDYRRSHFAVFEPRSEGADA